jgi:hypothetical protein
VNGNKKKLNFSGVLSIRKDRIKSKVTKLGKAQAIEGCLSPVFVNKVLLDIALTIYLCIVATFVLHWYQNN